MVRWPSLGTFALVVLAWTAPVAAQESEPDPVEEPAPDAETEAARASFQAGLELADRGEWEAASARFREALALRDSPAVRTNLAISLAESGNTIEALAELDRVLAEPELDAAVRREVETRRTALRAQLGRLRIDVAEGVPDPVVTVDGEPWAPGDASVLRPPGAVTVAVSSAGRALDSREAVIPAGGDANVVFSWLAPASADEGDDTPLVVGLAVALGLALAGGAVALTFALLPPEDTRDGDFGTPVLEID